MWVGGWVCAALCGPCPAAADGISRVLSALSLDQLVQFLPILKTMIGTPPSPRTPGLQGCRGAVYPQPPPHPPCHTHTHTPYGPPCCPADTALCKRLRWPGGTRQMVRIRHTGVGSQARHRRSGGGLPRAPRLYPAATPWGIAVV